MKKHHVVIIGFMLLAHALQAGPASTNRTAAFKNKWFNGGKGYEEALALQKQTGANLFVYFFNYGDSSEKGLCRWWEKSGLNDGQVNKYLRDFIKVRVEMPLNKNEDELFASFRFNKTPAVYIVTPDSGYPKRCSVFDYETKRPKLKSSGDLIAMFTQAAAPAPDRAAGEFMTATNQAQGAHHQKSSNDWKKENAERPIIGK